MPYFTLSEIIITVWVLVFDSLNAHEIFFSPFERNFSVRLLGISVDENTGPSRAGRGELHPAYQSTDHS